MIREEVYIQDIIGDVVAKVSTKLTPILQAKEGGALITGVHYMYGHPKEIIARLIDLSSGTNAKFTKYPLVWLYTPFITTVDKTKPGIKNVSLRVLIINGSKADLISPQRYEKNIKPFLKPIQYEFLNQLEAFSYGLYKPFDTGQVSYTEIDHDYWGKDQAANELLDFLDCVEITDLKLKVNFKNC